MQGSLEAIRVGVIGHRALGGTGNETFVSTACRAILDDLRRRRAVTVVTPAASGADTLVAECAASLSLPVEVVCAFGRYERDFATAESEARFQRLSGSAAAVVHTSFDAPAPQAYRKAMQWVVIRSHRILAVWDGRERGSVGGTWETLCMARDLGLPVVQVDPTRRTIRLLGEDDG